MKKLLFTLTVSAFVSLPCPASDSPRSGATPNPTTVEILSRRLGQAEKTINELTAKIAKNHDELAARQPQDLEAIKREIRGAITNVFQQHFDLTLAQLEQAEQRIKQSRVEIQKRSKQLDQYVDRLGDDMLRNGHLRYRFKDGIVTASDPNAKSDPVDGTKTRKDADGVAQVSSTLPVLDSQAEQDCAGDLESIVDNFRARRSEVNRTLKFPRTADAMEAADLQQLKDWKNAAEMYHVELLATDREIVKRINVLVRQQKALQGFLTQPTLQKETEQRLEKIRLAIVPGMLASEEIAAEADDANSRFRKLQAFIAKREAQPKTLTNLKGTEEPEVTDADTESDAPQSIEDAEAQVQKHVDLVSDYEAKVRETKFQFEEAAAYAKIFTLELLESDDFANSRDGLFKQTCETHQENVAHAIKEVNAQLRQTALDLSRDMDALDEVKNAMFHYRAKLRKALGAAAVSQLFERAASKSAEQKLPSLRASCLTINAEHQQALSRLKTAREFCSMLRLEVEAAWNRPDAEVLRQESEITVSALLAIWLKETLKVKRLSVDAEQTASRRDFIRKKVEELSASIAANSGEEAPDEATAQEPAPET